MAQETKSNDELRQIFQDRIDQKTEVDGDHIIVSITWHEPDENGCNWSQRYHGDRCWKDDVLAIEAELQNKYNLVNGANS